jgi:hypothetical protein
MYILRFTITLLVAVFCSAAVSQSKLPECSWYEKHACNGKNTVTDAISQPFNASPKNQYSYVGEWMWGSPNGIGVATFDNGDRYEGQFSTAKDKQVKGTYFFSDGRPPQSGTWLNNNLIQADQLNKIIKIETVQNKLNNDFSSLPKCIGVMQNSWWNDCFGVVSYISGARYIGEFKNHEQDGKGVLVSNDYWNGGTQVVKEGLWSKGRFIKPLKINLPPEYESVLSHGGSKNQKETSSLTEENKKIIEPPIKSTTQQNESALAPIKLISGSANVSSSTAQPTSIQTTSISVGKRLALVIGNGDYKSVPKLSNAINDANEITKALQVTGFTVSKYENIDLRGMQDAIREFGNKLGKNDVGLFYFAGHGVQVKGKNYLIPVGENIKKSFEVPSSAIDADLVLATMEDAKNNLNIVVLDACRSPFPGEGRSVGRGLATLDAAKGTLIAYSTAPGKEALDGDGKNSPYTKNLARVLQQNGLSIEQVFKQVRIAVVDETKGAQVPWENSSIMGDFYFRK